ncbi:MAG: hypothetical protein CSA65_01190 [Proteobacteria bacterium]|nr:MAG: hypothetical protein CSB49_08485 [Pseudomonadota bacterium]PIE19704.1 MAG: hypothetical protein CSA65_01190 [Pseudomonadota bacterium]
MNRLLTHTLLPALLAISMAAPAHAQSLAQRASNAERRLQLFSAHRGRLERQLDEQSKRIARLKKQPSSVGRDLQLKAALRASQQLANRLTKLQQRLRKMTDALRTIYLQALSQAGDGASKRRWRGKLQALRKQAPRGRSRLVTGAKANPLDSAEDLEEKADLLKDSERKVRRRLAKLSRRVKRLERQSKLRRHGRAATDSPFIEQATRRMAGTRWGTAAAKQVAPRVDEGPKVIGAAPPPSDRFNGNNGGQSGKTVGLGDSDSGGRPTSPGTSAPGSPSTPVSPSTLDRGLDPATLQALKAARTGSPRSRLAALKRAKASLARLAQRLRTRAAALRAQAKARKPSRKK